jgi:hypothetical protein
MNSTPHVVVHGGYVCQRHPKIAHLDATVTKFSVHIVHAAVFNSTV